MTEKDTVAAKSKDGRPSKYSEEMLALAENYLKTYKGQGDHVPTLAGLAINLNVAINTLYNWAKSGKYDDFLRVFTRVEEEQHRQLVNGGLGGDFNPAITKMMLTKHGYSDRQEIDHRSEDGSMTPKPQIDYTKLSKGALREILAAADGDTKT